jgi:NitT/TauT family transport system permease protein
MKPAAGTMGPTAAAVASHAAAAGRGSLWREVLGAFSPNRVISKAALRFIIAFQVAVLLIVWATSTYVFLPKPMDVWRAFVDLWAHEGLGQELIVSFLLNVQAMAWATLISLVLAYLTVVPVFQPIAMAISKGRFIGMVGLTFFFTIIFSSGHQLKVSLLVFAVAVFFVTSMIDVVAQIPKEKFDLARTLRMGEWRVVWEVIVLGKADAAFDAMRQNAAIGWMMLTMVEGISRSEGGVGALLLNQNKHFRLEAVFAIQIAILLIGLFQDYALGLAKKFLFPYADLQLERK